MPTVPWKVSGHSTTSQSNSVAGKKKGKKSSWLFSIIELFFFIVWLIFTGITGFYFGYDPTAVKCPGPMISEEQPSVVSQPAPIVEPPPPPCPSASSSQKIRSEIFSTDFPEDGYSYQELKAIWQCSHSVGNMTELNRDIFPSNINLQKTKWKSILTVEPKQFFDRYLSQYPGDTRATQPVMVFSHKPLNNFEELSDVCKVLDIAVVPDRPGVCVAVTETYHDVASYHMLHAERQEDGKFALSANFIDGRSLPEEEHYKIARTLLLDYFEHQESIMDAMKSVPKYGNGKVTVGVLIDDDDDVELFLNSFASARKKGISNNKFVIFTTNQNVMQDLSKTGIKIIYLKQLANLGKDVNLDSKFRRYFLQTWLAFSTSNALIKMIWQSPGTIWMERPDNIVKAFPIVETSWAFKGRKDKRSAPFFISFDFFIAQGLYLHAMYNSIIYCYIMYIFRS
jgi:hypothetical protein